MRRLAVLVPLCSTLIASGPAAAQIVEFADGIHQAEIPFELNAGKIYVKAQIEDAEACWMIFDTGSPRLFIDGHVAQGLDLALGQRGSTSGAGSGRLATIAVDEPVDVVLGDITLVDAPATIAGIDERVGPYEGRAIGGLVGVGNLAQHFVIEIDYARSVLRVHDPDSFEYEGPGASIPIVARGGRMMVETSIDVDGRGVEIERILIDTGYRGSLAIIEHEVRRHGLLDRVDHSIHALVGAGLGGEVRLTMGRARSVGLGPVSVESVPLWLDDGTTPMSTLRQWDGILGSGILRRFRTFFDYQGERIILEPAPHDADEVDFDKSGLFIVADGSGREEYRVLDVVDGSPGDEAGLRVGDIIVDVSGVHPDSLETLRRMFRRPEGTVLEVLIERAGSRIETSLGLRRQF